MTTDPQTPVSELSGRDLDKAVHREVFGWTFTEDMPVGTGEHVIDGDEEWRECHPTAAPLYSSEPMDADTWSVVEELGRRGYHVSVCPPEPTGASCVVSETARGSVDDLTEADTAPLAICRAALKAVRDE